MNFSEFLRKYKTKMGFASVRIMFDSLGGEKKLQMTLRHFQLMEAGTQAPSSKAFLAVFRALPPGEYQDAIVAFFKSAAEDDSASELLDYLERHLTPAYLSSEKSIWESSRPRMTYSEEQLQFLSKNPEAMRLQHRLMLWEAASKKELSGKEDLAKKLVDNELAHWDGAVLKPTRTLFRVPKYEDSAPSAVRKGTQYLLSHLNVYLSEEGGAGQEITYAIQLVSQATADKILEEMVKFKKWVQSIASQKTSDDLVPFLFLGFGKTLKKKDF